MSKSSTIKISVVVDDKGSVRLKKLGDVSKTAGAKGEKSMRRFRKSIADLDNGAKLTLGSITKLGAITLAGGVAAFAALTAGMIKSIGAASDLAEVQGKFDVVFDGQQGKAESWAAELVNSYAMSRRESKQYLSSIQDLLVPMGMVPEAAGKMSFGVTTLAADLGSFNNIGTAQVMDDIQSALVGNYETMKKYGVVINATTVQEKALAMGLATTKEELIAADKAQAAYKMMLEGSAAAIGDMARTADGYANQLKLFDANVENLTASMGKRLLPVAADVMAKINAGFSTGEGSVDSLAEVISVKLLSALGYAVETMRFFHNGWLGIKLVGTAAINAIAVSVEYLFGGIRNLLKPLDMVFAGLVKIGAIDVNPFDGVEQALGTFAASSSDVTAQVMADIAKTNAGYDSIKAAIAGYVVMVKKSGAEETATSAATVNGVNAAIDAHKRLTGVTDSTSSSATEAFNKRQSETNALIIKLNALEDAKSIQTDSWLVKDQLTVDATENTNKKLAAFTKEFTDISLAATSDIVAAFSAGEDTKVAVAGIAQSYLAKYAVDAATKGLEPIFEALGGQIGAWIGLGAAQTSTEGGSWTEKLATAGLYLVGAGAAVLAGKAVGNSFHAEGGWLGANSGGGMLRGGSGIRDDIFLGYTDGGATRNWGMGGEFVVNKESTSRFLPLLESINSKKFAEGGTVADAWGPTRGLNDSGFDTFWDTVIATKGDWWSAVYTAIAYYGGAGAGMLVGKALGKNMFTNGGVVQDKGYSFGGWFKDILDPGGVFHDTESTEFIDLWAGGDPGSNAILSKLLPLVGGHGGTDYLHQLLGMENGNITNWGPIWNALRKLPIVGETVQRADKILYPFVRDTLTPGANPNLTTVVDMLKGAYQGLSTELASWIDPLVGIGTVAIEDLGGAIFSKDGGLLGQLHGGTDYVPKTGTYLLEEGEKVTPAKGYSGDSADVVAEIRALRKDLASAGLAIAANTGKTAKILARFEYAGIHVSKQEAVA